MQSYSKVLTMSTNIPIFATLFSLRILCSRATTLMFQYIVYRLSKDNVVHNKVLTRLWSHHVDEIRYYVQLPRLLQRHTLSPNDHTYETSNTLGPVMVRYPSPRTLYQNTPLKPNRSLRIGLDTTNSHFTLEVLSILSKPKPQTYQGCVKYSWENSSSKPTSISWWNPKI